MQRLAPYLGIVAALALALFIMVFSGDTAVVRAPAPVAPTASSTLSVSPGLTLPPLTVPNLELGADTATTSPAQTTSAPKRVAPQEAAPEPVPVAALVPIPAPVPLAPTPAESNAALDEAAMALRAALVNIICYAPMGSGLRSMSGSGVFIDSKGVILTNAHVALSFLLADRNVSCTIRAGSPAVDKYEASLIYISPAWIQANADILAKTAPNGTGEYDFALLAVTGSATNVPLPSSFPSIPLATTPPTTGTPVVIASYGAQFLESSQIQNNLFPTVVFGSVKDIFTFAVHTIDVLALGGSAAAQEGSSGGGVADASGALVGTITTSTVKGTTDTRSLDAITASYIRAEYASETGQALDILLAGPTSNSITNFASQIPTLEAVITANLP